MGRGSKSLAAFIDSIPDSKLKGGFPSTGGTIYNTTDFRLDMQGMTSGKPPQYNLQIQVNKGTRETTLKKLAPKTVAGPTLVPSDKLWTPDQIRADLRKKMKI